MTIRELAKAAGVSSATVSRMINKNGFVSKDARARISAAMKAVGYHPANRHKQRGPKGSSSAFLKHRIFTMLWTSGTKHSLTSTGQEMMLGITEALRPLGVSLLVDYIDSDNSIPKCLNNNKTDGLFLHGEPPGKPHSELIKKFPAVWLLQAGGIEYGDRVQPDHRSIGVKAYQHLEEAGCKNVCCVSHSFSSIQPPYWYSREQGFTYAAKFGKTKCNVIHTKYSRHLGNTEKAFEAAVIAVDKFLSILPRPDGIFVANAMGAYVHSELKRRGIIPMKDVYMICGDLDSCGQFLDPDPVKIDIQGGQIGKLAVNAMLWRIKNPQMSKINHSVESLLMYP